VKSDGGVALILALLVLSFLTVLGGALLTASTIDVWISGNYKAATQSLYVAEAGLEDARQLLRSSSRSPQEWLTFCAGLDGQLQTSDDLPLIALRPLTDRSGRSTGSYEVWLRDASADETLTLLAIGRAETSRKTIELAVRKGAFPDDADDPRLKSVAALEDLAASVARNATDVFGDAVLSDFGSPSAFRVAVVNGNLTLGPGTGHGLLVVRGDLDIAGDLEWTGLIAVIGTGVLRTMAGAAVRIHGGVFVAQTREADGKRLAIPAAIRYDITDAAQIRAASRRFPYNPVAMKEK